MWREWRYRLWGLLGGRKPSALVNGHAEAKGAASRAVLHLWAGNLYGGVETFLATLASCRDLQPTLRPHFGLCFEGRLSRELESSGAAVHLLGGVRLSRPWTVWSARRRLRRLLRQERFAAVCCHGCWPHAVFAPALVRQVPLVFWAHDFASGQGPVERRAGRTRPDFILANSRATAASMVHLFPGVPVEAIGLPVNPPADHKQDRTAVRSVLGAGPGTTVIIQVSRLESWKGHVVLLQALSRLRNVPNWVCWIVGGVQRPHERNYLEELQRIVAEQQLDRRVSFLGQRDDVPRLLGAADIHCQPNTGPEPFGIAFVEALYAGLPVVTSAHGGALEIVDETCGILVPPSDVDALAGALGRLIDNRDLCTALGQAGPARAAALCDPARHLGRLDEVLGRLERERDVK
jgi:glycosyltransferase involved in cell wall biosynthesis